MVPTVLGCFVPCRANFLSFSGQGVLCQAVCLGCIGARCCCMHHVWICVVCSVSVCGCVCLSAEACRAGVQHTFFVLNLQSVSRVAQFCIPWAILAVRLLGLIASCVQSWQGVEVGRVLAQGLWL